MITEKYILTFYGLDMKFYSEEYIAQLWEDSANKEYLSSGIYVTGFIDVNRLVCGKVRGCSLGEVAYVISVTRNPIEIWDKDAFKDSFINVAKDIKVKLENPLMTLSIQELDTHFFADID